MTEQPNFHFHLKILQSMGMVETKKQDMQCSLGLAMSPTLGLRERIVIRTRKVR